MEAQGPFPLDPPSHPLIPCSKSSSGAIDCPAASFDATMVTQAQYLTGDKKGIEEFIGRFDVSPYTVSSHLNLFIWPRRCRRPSLMGLLDLPV